MKQAGILLGPSFLGINSTLFRTVFPGKQASLLQILGNLSVAIFAFTLTMRMDIISTLRGAKRCWQFGVISSFTSYIAIETLISLHKPIGKVNNSDAINILTTVITISSVISVTHALQELNLFTSELGQIAMSSSMISEIMQYVAISLQFQSLKDQEIFGFVIGLPAFMLLSIFVIRPTMKMIVQRTPLGQPLKEIYVVMILMGALVTAAIGEHFGAPIGLGPMMYGLVMPNGPPLATTITEKSEVMLNNFFMPFFYTHIGMKTNFKLLIKNWKAVIQFQCVLFVAFLIKVVACVLIAPTNNIRPKHGMALGLILSMKGLLELIICSRLRIVQTIDDQVFSQMVLFVVLMASICAPLIKVLYKHHPRVLKSPGIHEGQVRMIQNTPENTEFNIVSCLYNDGNVHSMIALLEACNPCQESPMRVHAIHLVELSGKFAPILIPVNNKNIKSLSINYPNTNAIFHAFENFSNNSSGPVTILSYVNVAPYNSMHEAVCNLVDDNSVPFLIIPFHENDQSLGTLTAPFIHDLNTNFLATVRCTVGILVDKYSRICMSISKLCFDVGIFFIGGIDDREALTMGIRMLERSNIKISLLRFVMNENANSSNRQGQMLTEYKKETEIMLDESLVDEFKGKKYKNDNVFYHEVVVEDCIQLMEAILRVTDKNYDLVMVGKRHNIGDLTDKEMSNFMDHAEQLGIIGDMLTSIEFCNGVVPVLVFQCGDQNVKQIEGLASS
ncbi:hypothetical protein RIF29_09092 [Crotalaria pallida]|uniref:Cation/H+ exchanger domain-containing protein n=1 Tax=Crotalaria pallida TaxID=3830 RepID=A0AAN9FZ87_CROPI